jgi:hypothetical protein
MKKVIVEKSFFSFGKTHESNITRKEAIRKAGYASICAATMLILLNDPKKSYASSSAAPDAPTGWPKKI